MPHVPRTPQGLAEFGPELCRAAVGAQVGSKQLAVFTLYSSPTFDALGVQITQPDGASKLCLGCHDGSYAGVSPDHVFGEGKAMTLSESHPISFRYDTSLALSSKLRVPGSLRDPATVASGLTPAGTIATNLLDANGKMQCSSCHDIHHSGLGTHHLRYEYESDGGRKDHVPDLPQQVRATDPSGSG